VKSAEPCLCVCDIKQEAQLLLRQPIVLRAGVRSVKTTTADTLSILTPGLLYIHCDRSVSTCE